MDAQSRQAALDNISAEDLAKIQAHQASTDGALKVDNEWLLLAEWLDFAGYQAYLDAKNNAVDEDGNFIITMPEILTLLEAKRKLEYLGLFRNAQAALIGAGAANSKKPSKTFKALTKDILKKIKVDE